MNPAVITGLITAGSSLVSNWYNKRQEKKAYKEQQDYNSPKAQMARYSEAGLSPYLIYGQGNSGNMTAPSPVQTIEPDTVEKGISAYTGMSNFDLDLKAKRLDNALRAKDLQIKDIQSLNMEHLGTATALKNLKTSLETLADFPDFRSSEYNGTVYDKDVSNSYRRKLNELKMAASQAGIDRVRALIQGIGYENVVKRVRSVYANDFGMVGGDWTQGLGLIKSIPSFFKSKGNLTEYQKQILKRYPK